MPQIILFNKPFNVLSQFSGDQPEQTLSHYIDAPGFYPAGRLDKDSEGLLLLTDCGQTQARISNPTYKLEKTYWVQVEGLIDETALHALHCGVTLKDGQTRPARAEAIIPPRIWDRHPPIRERQHIPTSWLSLSITEGRNRQVRRMTAAVGFPTLRLIRYRIGDWTIEGLAPGESRTLQIQPLPGRPASSSSIASRSVSPRQRSTRR
ncbi:pseudouridine synthase [Pseudohongiella spirulinae]|uniref:pseudouridine synthase n=1 Tax=Pseudohongiella spirulinae TaxID=1249552 RepID=UPI0007175651|nr:pseudouridine synthase [Pseudohongiella spirulinae]